MANIKTLSPETVAAIATGQVIERPSSVVKELVENALDAGATQITIKLVDGGRQEINIIDNGLGMSKEELLLSVQAYTTSKIARLDDLKQLKFYGFRGEALASIALVSQLQIQSKQAVNTFGHYLQIKHGNLIDEHSVGMIAGTKVSVTELFRFQPARKKFLKSATTELQQIYKVILPLILINLQVSFRVEHNNSVVIDCPLGQTFLERVLILLDQEYHSKLLPVQLSQAGYRLTGFIGVPQIASPANSRQFLWVNTRPVFHDLISRTIKLLYGTLLEPKATPVYFLQLVVPPEAIDVNIYPQKTSVSFLEEEIVVNLISAAVTNTLTESGLIHRLIDQAERTELLVKDSDVDKVSGQLKQITKLWTMKNLQLSSTMKLFQLHKLYLVLEVPEGVLLIDQHSAHERVLYEQFLAASQQHVQLHQLKLSVAQKLNLVPYQAIGQRTQKLLASLGISLEEIDREHFVSKIPVILQHRNYQEYIKEVIEQAEQLSPDEFERSTQKIIAFLACRSAIKAGEPLTAEEQKNLVEKLLKTKSNYTCQHGRPVFMYASLADLARIFKRTGF
ncbi:MAG: hypothetical protein COU66_01925 [Candidatus Pacebacteria bacterium CG10_big_fil_rev_8_21_14_0_10_44_11]|nr:MAG: hypothetical protein COU66_01925 [Candidatus Pacebacteria bacterium CG10_big_fil_rev_8_21_14_0_10_44_11]